MKEDETGGTRNIQGQMGNAYNILAGKVEWKKSVGIPRRRLKDNIKMDMKEITWKVWTELITFMVRLVTDACEYYKNLRVS
jgi:hypothetical protein